MLNLKEVLEYLDDEENTEIHNNHNAGLDRDLLAWQLEELMNRAINRDWYHTSFWVTGPDTMGMLRRVFGVKYRIQDDSVEAPILISLFDRPMLMMNVRQDTLSRVYLVNYGAGEVGSVLRDLQ